MNTVYAWRVLDSGICMQWVNGVEVVSHSGGHLPFQANITDLVKMGAPNRITVAINNTLTPHTLPPGTLTHGGPPELPEGFVSLNYQFDFYNYAGECMGVYQSLCWTLNRPLMHFLHKIITVSYFISLYYLKGSLTRI